MPSSRIMIGSDPEFMLKAKGFRRVTYARDILRGGTSAKVGTDGASSTGEFRPDPAFTVDEHIQNIQDLVQQLVAEHPGYWALGGSSHGGHPIGGHIHFSGGNMGSVTSNSHLTKCLDTFLALPVMMLEGPKAARSRRKNYGRLSDVRRQPHGGIEYRTLPSWLVSKKFAKAVLDVSYLLATCADEIPQTIVEGINLHGWRESSRFYNCDKEFFRPHMETIFATLEGLTGSAAVMDSINYLEQEIADPGNWWQSYCINKRWELHRRRDRSTTAAGRQLHWRTRATPHAGIRITGTSGDDYTVLIAHEIQRANVEGQNTYVIYGVRDDHDIDVVISASGVSRELITRARGMGISIRTGAVIGPNATGRTIRIGLSMNQRRYNRNTLVILLRRIINELEAET